MLQSLSAALLLTLTPFSALAEPAAPRLPTDFNVTSALQLKVGGSFETLYTAGPAVADGASVKRARLRLEGRTPEVPELVLKLQTEFTQNPALLDLTLEYLRGAPLPDVLKARAVAGQFKPGFGREHLINDDYLETVNRSAVSDALAPGRDTGTKGRDVGAMLELAASPWGVDNLAVYKAGAFNGEGANTPDKNDRKNFVTRLEVNPAGWLSFGGSYEHGSRGALNKVQDRVGWDAKASYGPASVTFEEIDATSDTVRAKGQYVLGTLWLWKRDVQAVARYDWYDPDLSVSTDRTYTTTLGLNWYPAKALKVMTDYEIHREDGPHKTNDVFLLSASVYF